MIEDYKAILNSSLNSYSSILFLNSKYVGFFLLVITFINPSVAISGIVAIIFTILFAEAISLREAYLYQGFYLYNSLLVGMGIGFIFEPSYISIILIAISSSLTFMLSFVLNKLFSNYKIPILSLPFSLVTIFIYLASIKYVNFPSIIDNSVLYDIELPLIISGLLKSFGSIFFLPNNIAGMFMLSLVVYFSRIAFVMALVGYYFGITLHSSLMGISIMNFYDPYAYNYILVAISLCGVFLLPTIKNFMLSLVGIAISVVLTDAISVLFNYYSVPVFTIPFNLTIATFIFTLSMIYYKEFNLEIKATPEKSLSNYLSKIFRFGSTITKISLPFSGQWSVYQSFDDKWTHKGKYKYAYDFVKMLDGKTYKNDGLFKEDYFAFGESILSPVNGYVVDLRFDLIDNDIGGVDRVNNWGNYIIIKADEGFFVEISHIMRNSICVNIGDYVQINKIIAKCGNSGYSPEPHIHIQVQEFGVIGSFTKEFIFNGYMKNNKLILNSTPKNHELLNAIIHDRSLSSRFLFILDDIFKYEVFKDGVIVEKIVFVVKMDTLGEFYFSDKDENKLYFFNDLKQFYFYNYVGDDSYLKQLFILAPRVPFISNKTIKFSDYLPLYLTKNKIQILYRELLSTIKKDFYKNKSIYKFDGTTLFSNYGEISIQPLLKGFSNIKYNNIELKRVS